jgi:hypothetical protein
LIDFETEWARCGPWIEAALAHAGGTHTLADVKAMVCDPDHPVRFWAGQRSALVTEVQTWPNTTTLLLWLAGGDLAELRDELRPMAEAWGRDQGCERVMIVGRPGWARALPGYAVQAVVCGKEL